MVGLMQNLLFHTKRVRFILNACLVVLIAGVLAPRSRAALVIGETSSIFYVDGLLADGLDRAGKQEGGFFHAEIKKKPLVEPRRRYAPRYQPRRVSLGVAMPPRGMAMEQLKAAQVFAQSQDWKRALAAVQRGLDMEPNNMLLVRRAAAYAALARQFGAADEYFRRAVAAYPDDVPFLTGRAGILVRLLRLSEAEALLEQALEIQPDYLAARFNMTCIAVARGETGLDEDEWKTIARSDAAQIANWLDADRDDYMQALSGEGFKRLCRVVLGEGTDQHLREIVDALRNAGRAMRQKRWREAERLIDQAKTLGVKAAGLEADIAVCRYEQGDEAGASAILEKLAVAYPQWIMIQYNYAYTLIEKKQYEGAAEVLEAAREVAPENPQIAFSLACAYAGMKEMDQAWPILVDLASEHGEEMGTWVQGDESYLKAIRNDPRFPQLRLLAESEDSNVPL